MAAIPMRFPDKYTTRDKHLLRLERELARLRHAHWHAPIIPLEHPYQRGWVKSFVVREDALQHPEATAFKEILKVVNHEVFSRNRAFIDRKGAPILLLPRIIPPRDWRKLAWPIKCQRLFAFGRWSKEDIYPWSLQRFRSHIVGFKLMRAWWLDENVQPNMITHQRVDLPEVRSRIAEIEAYMEVHLGWKRLGRLHGQNRRWDNDPAPVAEQRACASFADQLDLAAHFNYD
jgi:hypothetical protein